MLTAWGSMSKPAADFLATLMQVRSSLLISGQPGAGKTSLLAALIEAMPRGHVLRSCEEVRELPALKSAASYYEAQRIPGQELRDLVKLVLGMRPHRIVIGEVKGQEAYELTRAANAGCGFACTIHANSAAEALEALVNAALMAGENVSEANLRRVFASALDVVVHVDLVAAEDGLQRQVMEIAAVETSVGSAGLVFTTQPLFTRLHLGAPMEWTGAAMPESALAAQLERHLGADGLTLRAIMEGGS